MQTIDEDCANANGSENARKFSLKDSPKHRDILPYYVLYCIIRLAPFYQIRYQLIRYRSARSHVWRSKISAQKSKNNKINSKVDSTKTQSHNHMATQETFFARSFHIRSVRSAPAGDVRCEFRQLVFNVANTKCINNNNNKWFNGSAWSEDVFDTIENGRIGRVRAGVVIVADRIRISLPAAADTLLETCLFCLSILNCN